MIVPSVATFYFIPLLQHVFSHVCVSVCKSVTFESIDLESSFLICGYGYVLRIFRSFRCVKVKIIGASEFCLAFVMLLVVAYIVLLASVVHCKH